MIRMRARLAGLRRRRGRAVRGLTVAMVAFALTATAARAASYHPTSAQVRVLARIDSLWSAGARESSDTLLVCCVSDARAARDTTYLAELLIRTGGRATSFGHVVRAEPPLREAVALAEARADSQRLCWALRWLGPTAGQLGKTKEATVIYGRQLALARALGDRRFEGWARVGLGWSADLAGRAREAVVQDSVAVVLFRATGDRQAEAFALNNLGIALQDAAAYPAALLRYREAAALARAVGHTMVEAQALNNVGTLEFSLGDPGRATADFQRAHEMLAGMGQARESLVALVNVAMCQSYLGRHADAAATAGRILDRAGSQGYPDLLAVARAQLASVRQAEGRLGEAVRLHRLALADAAALRPAERAELLVQLAEALAAQDSSAAALAVMARGERLLAGVPRDLPVLDFALAHGRLLLTAGRAGEGLTRLQAVAALARGAGAVAQEVGALAGAARAWRALGRADSSCALLERAAAAWETARDVSLDPEWREQRGASGRLIYTALAGHLLRREGAGPGGAATAFARLQDFKSRTLLERMRGPGPLATGEESPASTPAPADALRRFQDGTLREDELFLDIYLGPEISLLFAVTRDSCRAVVLPPGDELAASLRFWRDQHLTLTEAAEVPGERAALAATGRDLGRRLLGACADLAAGARRIILAPDGALNLLPLGELVMDEGEPCGGEPLLVRREWTLVPSANVLTALRHPSGPVPPAGPIRILAVAGGTASVGAPLRGAEAEARRLGHRFAGTEVRLLGPRGAGLPTVAGLDGYAILHFAAHARGDDRSPWRSSIGATPDSAESGLTAAAVARARLPARLAVLSCCGTAGGRVLSGEGVQGLTSAFLSAGVPTVVATLWSVDDAATSELMGIFYDRLAMGRPVATALREAQLAVRARARTAHPFFWAGFVVVGDGDLTLPLRARGGPTRVAGTAAALALVAGAGGLALVRRHRRRTGGDSARAVR